ncbi:hypothetical protein C8R46DRAFT_1214117 [Mycena filopes]|nr:hypothetical protein C8R46DRAFT_1214117 [Mycena filopes]
MFPNQRRPSAASISDIPAPAHSLELLHIAEDSFTDQAEYPYGFLSVGKLVFFPALIAVSSFLFVPVQPLYRDMDAFNDDWNDFNDLDYCANKLRPSTPHPTRALGRISIRFPGRRIVPRVFVPVRDMDAFNNDWSDFNATECSASLLTVRVRPDDPETPSLRASTGCCIASERAGVPGLATSETLIKQIPRQAHELIGMSAHQVEYPYATPGFPVSLIRVAYSYSCDCRTLEHHLSQHLSSGRCSVSRTADLFRSLVSCSRPPSNGSSTSYVSALLLHAGEHNYFTFDIEQLSQLELNPSPT